MMMAIIATPKTPPITPPKMGPSLLFLLLLVFPWVPTVVGSDVDDGETGVADVVLGPENEWIVVESGDNALQMR